ncbi:hypothetical protein C9J48_27465 [Photobacterium profundum]|uniref:N-acetylneuraminic acid synthase-like protein n=1 Tax=Photobacterium profundum 3TCK TaxID=314280 RepID=Q1Z873_9GAMM|nr:glycosyltransferase family 52 [Photobacterium profundum]EAS44640.1 N-acetylneuraminic acid synthase-like protein [Photobacterium profundum 3TCK]PSV56490.1 hypothetical protein C9J48_27465 [Photobacterium profundum]
MNKRESKSCLVYENTMYSLFLYILFDDKWKEKNYLFFGDRLSESFIENFSSSAKNVSFLNSSKFDLKKRPVRFYYNRFLEVWKFRNTEVAIGQVNTFYIPFKKIRRIAIEDGMGTYVEIRKLANGGSCRNLKQIISIKQSILYHSPDEYIITGSEDVPASVNKGFHVVDLKKQWEQLENVEKKEIQDIFSITQSVLERAMSRKILLLTQCFSEDGFMEEKDKITGYKKLISNLGFDENQIIIKTHPRERTDYRLIFPNACIIDEKVPFELLSLLDIKYSDVITLTSTSVYSLQYDLNIFFMGYLDYFNFNRDMPTLKPKIIQKLKS